MRPSLMAPKHSVAMSPGSLGSLTPQASSNFARTSGFATFW